MKAPEMSTTKPSERSVRPQFELDRLELSAGEPCEIQGRWFGVRGRRFLRPALTVVVDGHRTRLLADLAHKPWAAEEGSVWNAAFPSPPEGELLEAELTVAPDITVPLAASDQTLEPRQPASDQRREPRQPAPDLAPALTTRPSSPKPLEQELDNARDQAHRLQQKITYLEAERTQAAARSSGLADEVAQAIAERDTIAAERDAALVARDQAHDKARTVQRKAKAALRQASLERADAASERDDALAMRDFARQERDAAVAARDRALADQVAAVAARDAADAARAAAASGRPALAEANEPLPMELANPVATRAAARAARRELQPAEPVSDGGVEPLSDASVVSRTIAAVVLLAAIVAIVLMFVLPNL
jgi:hypothetical protein